MNINWFSPLPPARTGIAVVTDSLIPAFQKYGSVTLWTDQAEWDERLDREIEVRRFDPLLPPWPELNTADVSFFNIGNNPHFHGGIWRLSRRHSGIVVLHDTCLQHLIATLYVGESRNSDEYCRIMERFYGEQGRDAAFRFCRNGSDVLMDIADSFPLTPFALENALGAVVHHDGLLTGQPSPPILPLPLPVPSRCTLQSPPVLSRALKKPYRLLVLGFLGANRRLLPILEALAGLPQKSEFRLRVCGTVENSGQVTANIHKLGLAGEVELTGYLSEEALGTELAQADMAINLRYPTMGEASASQLKLWEYALPTLVTDVGWYAKLPPETVAFVRPESEIQDIQKHLQSFLENPLRFREMGHQGWQKLKRDHAPDAYVKSLVELAAAARRLGQRVVRFAMAERVGDNMRPWATPEARDVLSNRLAGAICEIAGPADSAKAASA